MAIDRKTYSEEATPLPDLPEEGGLGDIEVETEDEDGGAKVFYIGENGEVSEGEDSDPDAADEDEEWDANLAVGMDEGYLASLGADLVQLYEEDLLSRKDWEEGYKAGMKLIGLKVEKRNEPWPNACGAFHPILAEAIVRYVSEAIMESFPPQGPANTSIVGKQTPELLKRAKRVKDELNYWLTVKMPEARPEMEMTFFRQCTTGSCFRKNFKDPILRRPTQRMVPAEDLVVSYGTSDLKTSSRYTHREWVSENDIKKLMRLKFYRKVELKDTVQEDDEIEQETDRISGMERPVSNNDRRRLEMYVDLDLEGYEDVDDDGDETGIALPYIVTIDHESQTILSIRRNHSQDNPYEKSTTQFSEYHYIRGYGFYGFGLLHLLGGTAETLTGIMRQLVDAGTLSNIPAGYKGKGMRINNHDEPLAPGELRDVEVLSGTLKDNLVWLPMKEPSPVLFNLMQELVDEGRRVGSVADMKIADASMNSPVGTTLALLERVMRVMSAVQARNNVSIQSELNMLRDFIRDMDGTYEYPVDGDYDRREDFGPPVSVIPIADPSATTISQRLIRYRAAIDLAQTSPHLYDMALLHRSAMEVMQIPNADKIVPLKDDFVPLDPVTENMNILMMRPVKSFMHQDHEAHIKVHMNAMQDPIIQQMIGQSPNAMQISAASMAHIQEHVAYAYRRRMEQMAGFGMPDPDNPVPPELEASISPLIAAAADKLLQRDIAEAAQQANQQAAQDPRLQIDQMKAETDRMEVLIREKIELSKLASADRKMQLEAEIANLRAATEKARFDMEMLMSQMAEGNKAAIAREAVQSREKLEGVKVGAKLATDRHKNTIAEKKIEEDSKTKRLTARNAKSKNDKRS